MSVKVTIDDIRNAGFCVDGLREWAEFHGMDIRRVVKGDYTVEELRPYNDANINRAIEEAERRAGENK
jgi:hypothetical protein